MKIKAIVPVVTTPKLAETREYYTRHFGFEVAFDTDHYLGLRAGPRGSAEIGFMLPDADARAFEGSGVTLGLEVEDVDREHARLRAAGLAIVQEPRDNPWGDRSMLVVDPNGVTVYLSHRIAVAPEFRSAVH